MDASQIGVDEHDCAEWNKEAIGTGAQSLKLEKFHESGRSEERRVGKEC